MMMGMIGPSSAVALAAPVVSYVSQIQVSGAGTSTLTATGVNIGNPAYIANRRVIVVVLGGTGTVLISSATINGISCDQITTLSSLSTNNDCIEFLSAPVPSGTTGVTIQLNYASASFNNPSLNIYNVDGSLLSSISPTVGYTENATLTGTNTTTVNTTTKTGGFILAGAWVGGGAGPTITASTETYVNTPNGDYSSSAWFSAHANGITANAANSLSTQGPPAGGYSGLGLAAYR